MRVLRVLPAEVGKELAGLDLQVERQRHALQVGFLQLHRGLVVLIELEGDIGEPFEIRVHCPIEHNFGVDERETASVGVMIPELQELGRVPDR